MPRYFVERTVTEKGQEDLPGFGSRMKRTAAEKFPEIHWEHSHVVSDASGVKTFCVYEAPNEEMVREHAAVVGDHVVGRMYVIAADITPADFAG